MSSAAPLHNVTEAPDPSPPREDHFVRLQPATWRDYERLLEIRGEKAVPRLRFMRGVLEIMSPSRNHESIKSIIGRLVEVFCLERGLVFSAYGSWTLKDEEKQLGLEPDECYVFGEVAEPQRPDLAIEIEWSRGGIDKLEIDRALGVREVWRWRAGTIHPYALRGEQYEAIASSEVLPEVDLAELASFIDRPTMSHSMREYRDALQGARNQRA